MVNVVMVRIPVQMELDTGALLMMYMYQENILACTIADNRHMSQDFG